jgi:hypothetical protein
MLLAIHVLKEVDGMNVADTVEAVYRSARSGSVISDALLSHARDGRATERVKGLIAAVLYGTEDQVRRHTRELLLLGHTSGADLGTGFCMTMLHKEALPGVTGGVEAAALLHEGRPGWS